ncbi:MAG TPA: hypothetical protein VNL77_17555, partial [Roseiflexaceae bacterium]|nr:hypothetical protein [Roseiflexaceae bacterium]
MTISETIFQGMPSAQANRVLVIGTLDTIRDRGKQVIAREQRNERRGKMERLALQVRSPYGGTFLLPLDVAPSIKGGELLITAKPGTPLALEGEIQLVKRFDRRFAEGVEDDGREVREMYLHVMAIRKPGQDEMYGTSAVWLTGMVAEPPRFVRHPELPDILLASTVLDVTMERPSPITHSRAVTVERMRVRVAVPVDHQHATLLYRPGNTVVIEGQVDCIMETQGGAAVEAQVEKLRADWEARQEELAGASEQDRR